MKLFKIKRCDNCGKLNPPILDNNPRLCAACATPKGFYFCENVGLGANGKINYWSLQLPFLITWRGFWTL